MTGKKQNKGHRNKSKNWSKNPDSEPNKSTKRETSEVSSTSTSQMVSKLPDSTEKATEITVEQDVIPVIKEEVAKSDENASEIPLVTQKKVEEPVESAVVDKKIEDEQAKPVEVVEQKPKVEAVQNEEKQQPVEEASRENVEVEERKEVEDRGEGEECEGEGDADEKPAGGIDEEDGVRKRSDSCQSKDTVQTESTTEPEPEVFTDYVWEKKDEEIMFQQTVSNKSYFKKFAVFLQVIDPEFRFSGEIGPCETFDSEGVQKIFEKVKERGFDKPCPFDEHFRPTSEEMRHFLSDVLTQTKSCLRLACAERGYEYKSGKFTNLPISAVWGEELDPLTELKTIKAILKEVSEPISKLLSGQESRFWNELNTIFDEVIPALETFNSKVLSENNISDCMATLHGRKELGFEIKEEEVDKMLEQSFTEDGFGEFPPTALYAPTLFTTAKQLKLIFAQLEKMSKVTDIRVKHAGLQTITRIIALISEDETINLLEEFEGHSKVSVEKMFGLNLSTFEINKSDPKRLQYFKIFYTALGENNPREDMELTAEQLSTVLKCFYLVFPVVEINLLMFKIIGTRIKEFVNLDIDRKKLATALLTLPEILKKRLEVGPEFQTGDITEDENSMYHQVVKLISSLNNKDQIPMLKCFLYCKANGVRHLISAEKVMRYAMKCIESGKCQVMAMETLKQISRSNSFEFPNEFFEDLILLALTQYSVPTAESKEKRYEFITTVFNIVTDYQKNHEVHIDHEKISEKWMDMGHPWFSVLYLSQRFPILQKSVLSTIYPWLSADIWTDDKKDRNDLKNYIPLAKVPIAWPNCEDLSCVMNLVAEHVPANINRRELYERMTEYVSELTIGDPWKKNLINALKKKVSFLTPKETKKHNDRSERKVVEEKRSKKEEKSKKHSAEAPVKPVDELVLKEAEKKAVETGTKETQTSPIPKEEEKAVNEIVEEKEETVVVDELEVISDISEDLREVKEDEEQKSELVKMKDVENTVEEDIDKEEEEISSSQCERMVENLFREDNDSEDIKTAVGFEPSGCTENLKPLKELDSSAFYGYYEPEDWDKFDDRIIKEIYRQRKINGYSNK